MGKFDQKQKNAVPVATFPALPFQNYILQPVVKFYVATGSYVPGETVNLSDIGDIGTIDFTTALSRQTMATITQLSDGTYSNPTFSYPPHYSGEPRTLSQALIEEAPKSLAVPER